MGYLGIWVYAVYGIPYTCTSWEWRGHILMNDGGIRYTVYSMQYTVYCILVYSILYTSILVYSILYTSIQYTVYCILYTVYRIPPSFISICPRHSQEVQVYGIPYTAYTQIPKYPNTISYILHTSYISSNRYPVSDDYGAPQKNTHHRARMNR